MPSSACYPEVIPQTIMPPVRISAKPHAIQASARRNCLNSGYRSNFPIKAYLSKWTHGKDLSLTLDKSHKIIHIWEHLELGFHSSGGYAQGNHYGIARSLLEEEEGIRREDGVHEIRGSIGVLPPSLLIALPLYVFCYFCCWTRHERLSNPILGWRHVILNSYKFNLVVHL